MTISERIAQCAQRIQEHLTRPKEGETRPVLKADAPSWAWRVVGHALGGARGYWLHEFFVLSIVTLGDLREGEDGIDTAALEDAYPYYAEHASWLQEDYNRMQRVQCVMEHHTGDIFEATKIAMERELEAVYLRTYRILFAYADDDDFRIEDAIDDDIYNRHFGDDA